MFRTIKSVLFAIILFVGFTSCEKEVSLENGILPPTGGSQSGTAVFTLDGSPSSCVAPIISGSYVAGTPLDISNSVVITATVTTPGTYTISTGVANGISFTGSGTFATAGTGTITLFGNGTPLAANSNSFSPGINGCSFIITTTGTVINPVGDFLKCKIDGVSKTFNYSAAGIKTTDTLSIGGLVSSSSIETLELQIIGTNSPAPGTYNAEGVTPGATAFIEAGYLGPALEIFYLDITAPSTRPHPFKVVITSLTATRVKGTFDGGMFDAASPAEKVFTEGSFDLPLQ